MYGKLQPKRSPLDRGGLQLLFAAGRTVRLGDHAKNLMLGRGELLPGSCRLVEGQIDGAGVTGTYSCPEGRFGVRLDHPSRAPADATRTRDFAVVLVAGSPPPGFLDALAQRVRRDEPSFQWLLEAPPESVREPGLESNGYYLPVLTSRELLWRTVGGAVILARARALPERFRC